MELERSTDPQKPSGMLPVCFRRQPTPMKYGVVLTALYFIFVASWVGIAAFSNPTKFSDLAPNAIGDTLAGMFAPLAFLWLVVTVFLQKHELELQREELHQSRLAQQALAAETRLLAESSERSLALTIQTQKAQTLEQADDRLLDWISDLRASLNKQRTLVSWGYEDGGTYEQASIFGTRDTVLGHDTFVRNIPASIRRVLLECGAASLRADSRHLVDECVQALSDLERISSELSKAHVNAWKKFHDLNLHCLREPLEAIVGKLATQLDQPK